MLVAFLGMAVEKGSGWVCETQQALVIDQTQGVRARRTPNHHGSGQLRN